MSKILLAISDRWVPDARVDAIADFAQRMDSNILVVHVVYGSEGSGAEVSPGERILDQIAGRLRTKGAKVETLLLFSDDIANATVKTAGEHGCTMIVLGLASKGMLARLIEGNVVHEVIRSTKTPVLLLPVDWHGEI